MLATYTSSIRLEELSPEFDHDLRKIFRSERPDGPGEPMRAGHFVMRHRRMLVARVAHWTGLYDVSVRSLINHFAERCRELDLWVDPEGETRALVDLTACVSALAMNRLYKGEFVLR